MSDRRVNTLWLLSLVCSLFAAFLATLVQQWSKAYMHIFQQANNPLQIARFRLYLFEGSERLPILAEVVLGLIHYFSSGDLVTSSCKSTQPFLSSSWFPSFLRRTLPLLHNCTDTESPIALLHPTLESRLVSHPNTCARPSLWSLL